MGGKVLHLNVFAGLSLPIYNSTADHHVSSVRERPCLYSSTVFIIPAVYYVLMNTKKESESNVRKKNSIHPFHFEYAAVKQKKKEKRKRKTEAGGRDETG